MSETTAIRTLVKSPPEIWAACSDADSLARHLWGFGDIKITRLEPETTVAWEGERASGTVTIEPTGWGTKVTLTATAPDTAEDAEDAEDQPEETPVTAQHADIVPQPGIFARLAAWFGRDRPRQPVAEPEPTPEPVAEPEPDPEPDAAANPAAALGAALDSLGQAHHRPFSQF